jgi:hypothetical protein
MSKEKIKIIEQPILNLKVEVDRSVNGNYEARMNWPSFIMIDLVEVFQMNIWNKDTNLSNQIIPLKEAEKKAKQFKMKLKAYILEKADKSELKNFDWSEWDIV